MRGHFGAAVGRPTTYPRYIDEALIVDVVCRRARPSLGRAPRSSMNRAIRVLRSSPPVSVSLGYARVSTGDQHFAGQIMRLKAAGAARAFADVISGDQRSTANSPCSRRPRHRPLSVQSCSDSHATPQGAFGPYAQYRLSLFSIGHRRKLDAGQRNAAQTRRRRDFAWPNAQAARRVSAQ
jgi:hypothetical protein